MGARPRKRRRPALAVKVAATLTVFWIDGVKQMRSTLSQEPDCSRGSTLDGSSGYPEPFQGWSRSDAVPQDQDEDGLPVP